MEQRLGDGGGNYLTAHRGTSVNYTGERDAIGECGDGHGHQDLEGQQQQREELAGCESKSSKKY